MNADHEDALRGYLPQSALADADTSVVMLGIDAEGVDLRVADRLHRIQLPHEITNAEQAREVLVQMADTNTN